MKKMLILMAAILLCSGCAINLPLTGNLDGTTAGNLRAGGLKPAALAFYADPETRTKELERHTDGSYAVGRAVIIPIGKALSNALYEGLKNSYEEVRWVERPDPLPGFTLLKISGRTTGRRLRVQRHHGRLSPQDGPGAVAGQSPGFYHLAGRDYPSRGFPETPE